MIALYSPKIDEKLIPVLYYAAQASAVPMTQLADSLIWKGLASSKLPPDAEKTFAKIKDDFPQGILDPRTSKQKMGDDTLESIVNAKPNLTAFRKGQYPYKEREELMDWYNQSIAGLGKSLKTSDLHHRNLDAIPVPPKYRQFLSILESIREDVERALSGKRSGKIRNIAEMRDPTMDGLKYRQSRQKKEVYDGEKK